MDTDDHQMTSLLPALPSYVPRFSREKPVIAIVGENHLTELTDYVVPYGILAESGVAQVLAIATQAGPIRMFPSLKVVPQATITEFDRQFPEGADYVVVPAVSRSKDPILLAWINQQAGRGATIIGICDGVWVRANAGLLDGKQAVGHWFSMTRLGKKFPTTQWLRNMRYVGDGNIITTTGVSASIPVSIALVEAIAGRDRAVELAQRIGVQSWGTEHQSEQFKLRASDVFTAVINWLSFWSHETIGISVSDKFDELPPEAKKQAQDFVDFLYQRYVISKEKKSKQPAPISDSSFFGIWKDREDMKDSLEWVRKIRKSQWSKQ